MKKLLTFIFILFITTFCFASNNIGNYILFGAQSGINNSSFGSAGGMIIDAANERVAVKFVASTTSAITDIDIRLNISGTVTGITFRLQIQGDSSDVPDGSNLGGTVTFSGPAADGWVGLKTLSTNTGALILNNTYWIVLDVSAGTPDGTDKVQLYEIGGSYLRNSREKMRHYDGTNWTNTSARTEPSTVIMKHADGVHRGWAQDSTTSASGKTDIFDTNRQGIKVTFGSKTTINGILLKMTKTGSPGDVTVKLYEGSTQRAVSNAISSSRIDSGGSFIYWFITPFETSGDSNIYITVEQAGTSGSNDWDFQGEGYSVPAYKETIMPINFDFIFGSGSDPTSYTVGDDWTPAISLIINNPATQFDEAAGGAGAEPSSGYSN